MNYLESKRQPSISKNSSKDIELDLDVEHSVELNKEPEKDSGHDTSSNSYNTFNSLRELLSCWFCVDWLQSKRSIVCLALGIYIIICCISNMYVIDVRLVSKYILVKCIMQIMVTMGVLISTYYIWPASLGTTLKEYIFSVIWYLGVPCTLISFNVFFVLLGNVSQVGAVMLSASVMLSSILIGWRLFCTLFVPAIYFGYVLYGLCGDLPQHNYDTQMLQTFFVHFVLIALAMTMLFIRHFELLSKFATNSKDDIATQVASFSDIIIHQDSELENLTNTSCKIFNHASKSMRSSVINMLYLSSHVKKTAVEHKNKKLYELANDTYENSLKLSTMILNVLDFTSSNLEEISVSKDFINFSKLIVARINFCKSVYLSNKNIEFCTNIQDEVCIFASKWCTEQVVDNLITNAINCIKKSGTITVSLNLEVNRLVNLSIRDTGIGIPHDELESIFVPFVVSSKTATPASGRGIGLALCKKIVTIHDGHISVESNKSWTEFSVKLPTV